METYLTDLKEVSIGDEFVVIDNSVLTNEQFSTYFGDNARVLFNQQCQKTNRKNKIASLDRTESNSSTPSRFMSGTYKRPDSTFSACSTLALDFEQFSKSSPLKSIAKLSCLPVRPVTHFSQELSESPYKRKICSALDTFPKPSYSFDQMMSRNIARRPTIDESCESVTSFGGAESTDPEYIPQRKSALSISVEFDNESMRGFQLTDKLTSDATQFSSSLQFPAEGDTDDHTEFGSALSSLSKGNMKKVIFELDECENDIDLDFIFEEQPLTPRTRFISTCIKEGLNPRASMVPLNS
jgi:hypothetical protein